MKVFAVKLTNPKKNLIAAATVFTDTAESAETKTKERLWQCVSEFALDGRPTAPFGFWDGCKVETVEILPQVLRFEWDRIDSKM